MKYLIHTYPKRLWYVEKYLIPSMLKQGIRETDIYIYNDEYKKGNLFAFMESLEYINENLSKEKGLWHLQDDVVLCKNFKEESVKASNKVINGFVNKNYANVEKSGEVNVKDYWYSFPCVYIPNRYIDDFLNWIEKVREHAPFRKKYLSGRYDDWFFYKFLEMEYPIDTMINLKPNLVDHIDYLIGYTTGKRRKVQVRAEYFKDLDLVKELERSIKDDLSQII